jgi:hypothetical protein
MNSETRDEYGLYTEEHFAELLHKQTMKSGFSGLPFVLVIFRIKAFSNRTIENTFWGIAAIIEDCFRAIDCRGWHKEGSEIGVICPGIADPTVSMVMQRIEEAFSSPLLADFRKNLAISCRCFPETATSANSTAASVTRPETRTPATGIAVASLCARMVTPVTAVARQLVATLFKPVKVATAQHRTLLDTPSSLLNVARDVTTGPLYARA